MTHSPSSCWCRSPINPHTHIFAHGATPAYTNHGYGLFSLLYKLGLTVIY